jgi:hypothetical protein
MAKRTPLRKLISMMPIPSFPHILHPWECLLAEDLLNVGLTQLKAPYCLDRRYQLALL